MADKTQAIDATDSTFEALVLARSEQVPVVVDFWAPWCGPCRTLGPIIEDVVAARAGSVELVKINVDENPQVSQAFKIQSIPAVFAVHNRKVVDSFVGALPKAKVEEFVAGLKGAPSEIDQLIEVGDEVSLRRALEISPDYPQAVIALAHLLLADRAPASKGAPAPKGAPASKGAPAPKGAPASSGAVGESFHDAPSEIGSRLDEVDTLLARIPETSETRMLAARSRLLREGIRVSPNAGHSPNAGQDPGSGEGSGATAGRVEDSQTDAGTDADISDLLDSLLDKVRDDLSARQEFIDILEALGSAHPLGLRYRKALAARLF